MSKSVLYWIPLIVGVLVFLWIGFESIYYKEVCKEKCSEVRSYIFDKVSVPEGDYCVCYNKEVGEEVKVKIWNLEKDMWVVGWNIRIRRIKWTCINTVGGWSVSPCWVKGIFHTTIYSTHFVRSTVCRRCRENDVGNHNVHWAFHRCICME